MRQFWPPAEAAQADYERMRATVLAGTPLADPAAARVSRGGLAALITRPVADPVFVATVQGAPRPAWTPHTDPRHDVLAASYALLLADRDDQSDDKAQGVAQ